MARNTNPLLVVLAVIGGIALVAILGFWLMHGVMMSGGMMGGMMGGMGAAFFLLGLLAVVGIVAVIVLLARRSA